MTARRVYNVIVAFIAINSCGIIGGVTALAWLAQGVR